MRLLPEDAGRPAERSPRPAASSAAEKREARLEGEEEESPKDTRVRYWYEEPSSESTIPWKLCGQQWTLEQPLHASSWDV